MQWIYSNESRPVVAWFRDQRSCDCPGHEGGWWKCPVAWMWWQLPGDGHLSKLIGLIPYRAFYCTQIYHNNVDEKKVEEEEKPKKEEVHVEGSYVSSLLRRVSCARLLGRSLERQGSQGKVCGLYLVRWTGDSPRSSCGATWLGSCRIAPCMEGDEGIEEATKDAT